jgi:cbb3-type cytochrome oxidase subunit 3
MDYNVSACLVVFNGMISLAILYFAYSKGRGYGF